METRNKYRRRHTKRLDAIDVHAVTESYAIRRLVFLRPHVQRCFYRSYTKHRTWAINGRYVPNATIALQSPSPFMLQCPIPLETETTMESLKIIVNRIRENLEREMVKMI